jgi:hypothetical protein
MKWLCLCLGLVLLCNIHFITAQITAFNSAPTFSLTFDSAPTSSYPGYEWQPGRFPNQGLAYFNGINHYIPLSNATDVAGRSFPNVGGAFSIECWVAFENWAHMSHFFDISNGNNRQNVFISNLDTGNGIRFGTIVKLADGTEQERLIDRPNLLSAGVFSHVVATMSQISTTDSTSNAAMRVSLYVNGALVGNTTQYQMPAVARTIQTLGDSTWDSDSFFNGWLDSVNYYNYPLSDQAVYAHSLLPRAPAFELTFGQDPRVIAGSSATFGFVLSDAADVTANVSQWHQGVVTLDGTSQYMDLATSSGSSTAGTTLPTIGGNGFGTGTNNYAQGWTFEVAFRTSTINSNSKIFDFSNNGNDRIYLGFESGSALYFRVQRGSSTTTSTSIISSVSTNTWYHIVIVVTPVSMTAGTAEHRVYVNGVSVANATGLYPDSVSRPNSYIGRSVVSTDSYCQLTFDLLRVHDFALTSLQARLLYYSVSSPVPVNPIPPPSIPTTTPRHVFNFDAQHQQTGYSSYAYLDNTNDGHFGVAAFNGVNSSVNLVYFPDSNGQTFTPVIGGEITFSCWVKWLDVAKYSRILDFGGALGIGDNNIILANYDISTQIFFRVYSGATSTTAYAPRAIRPGSWQHIVASVARNTSNPSDSTSTYAGILRIYVNGVLVSQAPGFLPPRVPRYNLLVGRSNWVADARFRGYIDSLQFYEYALDHQQVAAFACTTRPPVFDFSFTRDPRTLNSSITFNYGWLATDNEILLPNTILNPTNQNVTFVHQGMLTFNGVSQYVNLTAPYGPTNIGITLPNIGGLGSGVNQYVGWTFEVSFKVTGFSQWAKLFDWGVNNNGNDDILFGLVNNNRQMGFEILNSRTNRAYRLIVIENVELNRWYHVVVVVTPIDINAGTAIWVPYLDSEVLQGTTGTNGVWPDNVYRNNANIGKSNWNDTYFNGIVDSIRVYDYALVENDVRCLYRASRSAPEVSQPVALFNPGPQNSYSFEGGYDAAESAVANFQWVASIDGHNGVAYFDGANSFINMLGYQDGRQRSFPNVMGGTDLTFAAWVRFSSFRQYSRIFDIGNGASNNNLCLMNVALTSSVGFHVYSAYGNTNFDPSITWPTNQWVHVAAVISRNPNTADISSETAAIYNIYFNGTLVASRQGRYTSNAERLYAYIGKSGWSGDQLFNGYIDSFAWWDYAVPPASIRTLSMLSRPPYIDLTFDTDPRNPNVSSVFLYDWMAADTRDPVTSVHKGIINLNGPMDYYVDLMRTRGNHSIGVNMPQVGGHSAGTQSLGTYGWTFEAVFKYEEITNFCKIMNLGNGANPSGIVGDDNIIFGLRGTSGLFTFEVINSRSVQQSIIDLVPNITLQRWYSAVVVVEPTDLRNFKARYTGYIDGVLVGTLTNAAYPQGIYRENAFLGKSEWGADALCHAKVDLVRIYDYALSPNEVSLLASQTVDPFIPGSPSSTGSSVPGSSTAPMLSSGLVVPDLGCKYSSASAPANSVEMSLIFRNLLPSQFTSQFGQAFALAVASVISAPANAALVGCAAVINNGKVYNAVPGPMDTQVIFYILNSNGNAEQLATQLLSSRNLLQTNIYSYVGGLYVFDQSTLERTRTINSPSSSSSKLNGGAIAGIVIGVIVGVLLLVLLACCFMRGRFGSKKYGHGFEKEQATHQYDSQVDDTTDEGHEHETTEDETMDEDGVEMQKV